METDEPDIGQLKGYKGSIRLKVNSFPIYFELRKIPIHILLIVIAGRKE